MADTNLVKLKEITSQLKSLEDVFDASYTNITGRQIETKGTIGNVICLGLFKGKSIGALRAFFSKDSIFPNHCHDATEYVIVYEGELEHYIGDDCRTLKVNDYIVVDPGVYHWAKANMDTWVIAITIPADAAYPKGY